MRDRPRGRTGLCRPIGRRQTEAGRGKGGRAERPWPNHANWPRGLCGLAAWPLPPGRAALASDRTWQKIRMSRAWKLRRTGASLRRWKQPAACGLAGFWIGCPRLRGARRPGALLLRPAGDRRGLRPNSGKRRLSGRLVLAWLWPALVWAQSNVEDLGNVGMLPGRPQVEGRARLAWMQKLEVEVWMPELGRKTWMTAGLRDGHRRGASFENWLVWMSK